MLLRRFEYFVPRIEEILEAQQAPDASRPCQFVAVTQEADSKHIYTHAYELT
jgi:hypothetical protein